MKEDDVDIKGKVRSVYSKHRRTETICGAFSGKTTENVFGSGRNSCGGRRISRGARRGGSKEISVDTGGWRISRGAYTGVTYTITNTTTLPTCTHTFAGSVWRDDDGSSFSIDNGGLGSVTAETTAGIISGRSNRIKVSTGTAAAEAEAAATTDATTWN